MGDAILTGLLETNTVQISQVVGSVNSEESQQRIRKSYPDLRIFCGDDANLKTCQGSEIILLCVKPQMVQKIVKEEVVLQALEGKLLISICAGLTISTLKEWLPKTAVIRAMPNTPCKIRCGMTVLAYRPIGLVTLAHEDIAKKIFGALGRVKVLPEKHMDAVTGLSGSGPAFACVVLESLADGGVMMGLPRDIAIELAAQALCGASQMVLQTSQHPSVIKDGVTTPAGCTIAGLLSMEDGRIRSTIARAVQEATQVASNLGNKQI
jgi:pyrroline-5-carboxylate reductase